MTNRRPSPDLKRIQPLYRAALAGTAADGACKGDLVRAFMVQHAGGQLDDRLPLTPECRVVTDMPFRHGRADIVVFHRDGSATVIEAKDGAEGHKHVISGIGQAGLYAAQLAWSKGAVNRVRRALLWSSTGSTLLDALIEVECERGGVVPLPYASARQHKAAELAARVAVSATIGV